MPAVQTSPWNTHATAMMGDVCAPLASILRCCVCLLRAPRASDHVCTALRGGQRRRPAPEPSDTKCRGFGNGGTALVTLGDAQAPSQSCSAASFYLERRARPITPSLCDAQFCCRPLHSFPATGTRCRGCSRPTKHSPAVDPRSIALEVRTAAANALAARSCAATPRQSATQASCSSILHVALHK